MVFVEFFQPGYARPHRVAIDHIVDFHASLMRNAGFTTTFLEMTNGKRIEVEGSDDDVRAKLVRAGVTFL